MEVISLVLHNAWQEAPFKVKNWTQQPRQNSLFIFWVTEHFCWRNIVSWQCRCITEHLASFFFFATMSIIMINTLDVETFSSAEG